MQALHALCAAGRLALLCSGLVPAAVLASVPGDLAGVEASGGASYLFQVCATFACSPAGGALSSHSDGGAGFTTASVIYTGGFQNGASYSASGQIVSALALPELRAYASVSHGYGPHAGYSEEGGYDFSSYASARGVQAYTYTGSTSAQFGFSLRLTGGLWPSLAAVEGFAGLFDIYTTMGGELRYGTALGPEATGRLNLDSESRAPGPFDESFTVRATLQPGQSFYLLAVLTADVGRQDSNFGVADASNTFKANLTEGDASLLQIGVVPEPASAALWGLGLAGLAWRLRAGRR